MSNRRVSAYEVESNTQNGNSESLKVKKEVRFYPVHTMDGKLLGKLFRKPIWRLWVRDLSLY